VTSLAASIVDQAAAALPRSPRERGILFSPEMVRAILAGRKVQTRRLLNPADVLQIRYMGCEEAPDGGPDRESDAIIRYLDAGHSGPGIYVHCGEYPDEGSTFIRCTYGIPGDFLNVRETWATETRWDAFSPTDIPPGAPVHYFASGDRPAWAGRTRVSIHMPGWAARIRLRLDAVRVERLQAITEEDAQAEGVEYHATCWRGGPGFHWHSTALAAFADLWDAVNSARAPWDENPWVFALTFSLVHPHAPRKES
jgi:hypothetical protein